MYQSRNGGRPSAFRGNGNGLSRWQSSKYEVVSARPPGRLGPPVYFDDDLYRERYFDESRWPPQPDDVLLTGRRSPLRYWRVTDVKVIPPAPEIQPPPPPVVLPDPYVYRYPYAPAPLPHPGYWGPPPPALPPPVVPPVYQAYPGSPYPPAPPPPPPAIYPFY